MKGPLAVVPVLFQIAIRNLFVYKFKTFIITGLLLFGTLIGIIGLTLLKDIEKAMREGIVGSVAGDLQVYSDSAKDKLALFGGAFMGRPDIGSFSDLATIKDVVTRLPEVKAFVPMGTDFALLGRGNEIDEVVDDLRSSIKSADVELVAERWQQVLFQIQQLKTEIGEKRKIYRDPLELDEQLRNLNAAENMPLVRDNELLPGVELESILQFLETKVAPISGEKQPIYLAYLGVDIEQYYKEFSKFQITEGKPMPVGERGILISKKIRETQLKNLVARIFDKLLKRTQRSGVKIANDPENMRDVADLQRQYAQILGQLDSQKSKLLSSKLSQAGFSGKSVNLDAPLVQKLVAQLKEFLVVNDENIKERASWFYENIAPLIKLYQVSPGETLVLRSYTRSGFLKSVPLKVFGVFTFQGVEDSDIAGALNIVDLVSFRELYGQMTKESSDELSELRKGSGIKELSSDNAEDELFGSNAPSSASTAVIDLTADSGQSEQSVLTVQRQESTTYNPFEVKSGLALSAAIILKDPSKIKETKQRLAAEFEQAGLKVRVVDWQEASGIVGQFVNLTRGVLFFALAVILIVALVIINNSIVVATMGRIQEIGTLRALGAQRRFVLSLFLVETAITAGVGAVLGMLTSLVALLFLGKWGIPATADIVTFLFSGPRLYPIISWEIVYLVPLGIAALATGTSLYAARHAAYIQPVDAMQEKE